MKLSLFRIAVVSMALAAAAAACADSDNSTDTPPATGDDSGTSTLPEAGPAVDAGGPDVFVEAAYQECSDAGWCATNVPGPGTSIQDIWPLETHAFALATRSTTTAAPSSTKILEWDETTKKWTYIDDDSQNHISSFQFSNIWAPNDDEVYFTGGAGSTDYLFHGKRPVAPNTQWTWTQTTFACGPTIFLDFPQVWGTSATDVYLWGCNTVYHATAAADAGADAGDSGAPGWTVEFSDSVSALTITGTGPNDIWFVGTRAGALAWLFGFGQACTTAIRKTAAGYHAVVDDDGNCGKVGNLPVVQGVFTTTGLVGASYATTKGELIGLHRGDPNNPGNTMVKVDTDDTDGGTTVATGPSAPLYVLNDAWGAAGATPFVLGQLGNNSPTSFVLNAPGGWTDAGTFTVSTLIRNQRPNLSSLHRIRGTSSTNIWAVGDDNAYHKTTP